MKSDKEGSTGDSYSQKSEWLKYSLRKHFCGGPVIHSTLGATYNGFENVGIMSAAYKKYILTARKFAAK